MGKEYRAVAKKLGVRYLVWRYGYELRDNYPGGTSKFRPHLIRLDGWSFDTHEIIEAIANDPDMSIKYGDK